MDKELEKILLRFFEVVAKDLKHKNYKHVNDLHTDYMAFVAGKGLDDRLKQFVRRENEEFFKQRKDLTCHIVTAVAKNLLDPFYKVPRSNSARRVLQYLGEGNQKRVKEVEEILGKFWGEGSWDDYMATRFVELNSVDPNSFVVFEFPPTDGTELVQPYPYEVSSKMAIDYRRKNRVLEYLIAKDDHEYRLEAKPNEPDSRLPDRKKTHKKGHKFTLYTAAQTFQLLEVHENEVIAMDRMKEGEPKKVGEGGKTYVKLGKKFYQFIEFAAHGLDRVPAVQVGYYRDLLTNGNTYVSPLHPVVPYLEKTIKVNSELDLVATLLAFPQQIRRGSKCPDKKCLDGYYDSGDTCKTCGGLGVKVATAPTAQDAVVAPMPDSKEEMIPLDEYLSYNAPPVDIIKWQEEYVEKLTMKAKRIMYNSDTFNKSEVQETLGGKHIDMQNVYDTLHPFAVRYGKVWKYGVMVMAGLADRAEKLVATLTFGKDFKMKTLDTLVVDAKNANEIGSAVLSNHIEADIAQIIFAEKPLELQRYNLQQMHNPFAGKSQKEITVLMASNHVSRRDKVLYANFPRIFDELEMEMLKEKKDFYGLKRLDQREAIYNKVDEIIAELDADSVGLDDALGD